MAVSGIPETNISGTFQNWTFRNGRFWYTRNGHFWYILESFYSRSVDYDRFWYTRNEHFWYVPETDFSKWPFLAVSGTIPEVRLKVDMIPSRKRLNRTG